MAKYIHGKEVKQMVIASDQAHTRASLIQAIHDFFGEDTRYYSCSAEDLTADGLISFFEANGKLDTDSYRFVACEHHSH